MGGGDGIGRSTGHLTGDGERSLAKLLKGEG